MSWALEVWTQRQVWSISIIHECLRAIVHKLNSYKYILFNKHKRLIIGELKVSDRFGERRCTRGISASTEHVHFWNAEHFHDEIRKGDRIKRVSHPEISCEILDYWTYTLMMKIFWFLIWISLKGLHDNSSSEDLQRSPASLRDSV